MRKNIDLSDEAVKALSIQAIENGTMRTFQIKEYTVTVELDRVLESNRIESYHI